MTSRDCTPDSITPTQDAFRQAPAVSVASTEDAGAPDVGVAGEPDDDEGYEEDDDEDDEEPLRCDPVLPGVRPIVTRRPTRSIR
jgi:hypothetical protein